MKTTPLLIVLIALLFASIAPVLAQDAAVTAIIAEPDPTERFTIREQPVALIGTVTVDPAVVQYWKVDIKGNNRRSYVGEDPLHRTPAYDWVTVGDTRTDSVVDGQLALIPGWPTLSEGNWKVRLVVVGHDNQFLSETVADFRVRVPEADPVYVEVTQPLENQVIADNQVRGTLMMNQFAGSYWIDLLGGPYLHWTRVAGPFQNNVARPTQIANGVLATLPELDTLPPGQYELRLVVTGLDGNYIQEPLEVEFGIGTTAVSNLPVISITEPRVRSNRIRVKSSTPLIGTVTLPQGASYYKVEIKDNFDEDNENNQPVQFPDWVTIGSTHAGSVRNGIIETIPTLPVGDYLLRVVIVGPDGQFAGDPYEVRLEVQEP